MHAGSAAILEARDTLRAHHPTEASMKLYYSPLACSTATRIALYEAGAEPELVEVDGRTKQTSEGGDYRKIHGLGLVPALRADDGELIVENAAVLQYVADRFPEAQLAPRDPSGRRKLHQWLCFIGTELHKAVYVPLLDRNAPEAVKQYAFGHAAPRLSWLSEQLSGRDYLLDQFSVADAYLFAVLNWSVVTPIRLEQWPVLAAYMQRMHARPAVARAFEEEKNAWLAELQRRGESLPAAVTAA
jgi:glutathione S-transferase